MSLWPRAILFDFDNVLVNSEPLHLLAFQQVLKSEKIELSQDQYYREFVGLDDRNAFKLAYQQHQRPLEPKVLLRLLADKQKAMLRQIDARKYSALPGVEQFVRAVWRNYPLAICSGAMRDEVEMMLQGVALRDCFAVLVAAEDVAVGKPDPQGYLLALRRLCERIGKKLKPEECLVVEDAPPVIRSVRSAGFPVLAVATTYSLDKLSDANWAVRSLDCDDVQGQIPGLKMTRS